MDGSQTNRLPFQEVNLFMPSISNGWHEDNQNLGKESLLSRNLEKFGHFTWWCLAKGAQGLWWGAKHTPEISLTALCAGGIYLSAMVHEYGLPFVFNHIYYGIRYAMREDHCRLNTMPWISHAVLGQSLQNQPLSLRCFLHHTVDGVHFLCAYPPITLTAALSAYLLKKVMYKKIIRPMAALLPEKPQFISHITMKMKTFLGRINENDQNPEPIIIKKFDGNDEKQCITWSIIHGFSIR